jgi:hypothetical protein
MMGNAVGESAGLGLGVFVRVKGAVAVMFLQEHIQKGQTPTVNVDSSEESYASRISFYLLFLHRSIKSKSAGPF